MTQKKPHEDNVVTGESLKSLLLKYNLDRLQRDQQYGAELISLWERKLDDSKDSGD